MSSVGTSLDPVNWSEVKLEDFTFIKTLGEGTYSFVRLSSYQSICYTLKIILRNRIPPGSFRSGVPLEVFILQQLSHDNTPVYLGKMQDFDYVTLVFAYTETTDLYEIVKCRKLPLNNIKYVVRQLACVVSYLHSKSIAHRDIKPENILLDSELKVTLIDFGSAVVFKDGSKVFYCYCSIYKSTLRCKGRIYRQSVKFHIIRNQLICTD